MVLIALLIAAVGAYLLVVAALAGAVSVPGIVLLIVALAIWGYTTGPSGGRRW